MDELIKTIAPQHMMQFIHATSIRGYTRDVILAVVAELRLNGYDDAAASILALWDINI
jgi:hypothetical protein